MLCTEDRVYYRQRQEQALERARLAGCPEARHIHMILAERYGELIEEPAARVVSRAAVR